MEKNRRVSAVVALVGLAILVALFKYNQQHNVDDGYIVTNMAALFWLPMLLIFFVIRQEPSGFGFNLGVDRGYRLAALLFIIELPILILAATMESFQGYYPLQKRAAQDLAYFGYFELTYGMYLFCWEFFFRGFLLFGLARMLGSWSVFAQAFAFGIMHIGKPFPELAVSFLAGLILGIVALRTRSFLPCFVLHWASAVAFDVLVIMASRGLLF